MSTLFNLKKKPLAASARHARLAYRRAFSFSKAIFAASIVFLFMPLFVLVIYSFNASKGMDWTGFSFIWYEKLFLGSGDLWHAFGNSLVIALTSAGTATLLGTLAAIGVSWYKFRLRSYVQSVTFLPMILPEIIIGVSLLIFFAGIKLRLGLLTIFIAHTTFNLPFVYMLVMARLEEFDYSIVEAAHDLGANERQTLLRVIVPVCMPGIISGFFTAVTLSLEDFVITFFVSGPGSSTLPLYVYSAIRFGVSPVINSLSVLLIFGTVLLTYLLRNFLKLIASK